MFRRNELIKTIFFLVVILLVFFYYVCTMYIIALGIDCVSYEGRKLSIANWQLNRFIA